MITTGRFNNISVITGWCEDDTAIFLDPAPSSATDVYDVFRGFLPGFSQGNLHGLLGLYPVTDFRTEPFANGTIKHDAQFYRAARILRDSGLTSQPFFSGRALAKAGNNFYYYTQHQTILTPILEDDGFYGLGVIHTSEVAYMFGNFSHYDIYDFHIEPTPADYALQRRESRSWSSFAALGRLSIPGKNTLQEWETADSDDQNLGVYVIGGPDEGYAGPDGSDSARAVMLQEKLRERCAFLNSLEVIEQIGY